MSGVSGIIEREIELISRLISLLNEEQEYLRQGNADALPAAVAAKNDLVERLNALGSERMAAIGLAGDIGDRTDMDAWLAENAKDTNATVNWKKLLILVGEAKSLHELNGGMIAAHLKNTTETLNILTGQADKPALYGASGQSLSSAGNRIVDSA